MAGGGGEAGGDGGGGDGDGREWLFCDNCMLFKFCHGWWMAQHRKVCRQEDAKGARKAAEQLADQQAKKAEQKRAKERKKAKAEFAQRKKSASSKSTCENKKRNP